MKLEGTYADQILSLQIADVVSTERCNVLTTGEIST